MAFLILVIGDLHIPDRALDIPPKVLGPDEARSSKRLADGRRSSRNSSRPARSARRCAWAT